MSGGLKSVSVARCREKHESSWEVLRNHENLARELEQGWLVSSMSNAGKNSGNIKID